LSKVAQDFRCKLGAAARRLTEIAGFADDEPHRAPAEGLSVIRLGVSTAIRHGRPSASVYPGLATETIDADSVQLREAVVAGRDRDIAKKTIYYNILMGSAMRL